MTDLPYDYENIAREIARDLLHTRARDIEYMSILHRVSDLDSDHEIPIPQFNAIAEHVSELIAKATVTVELPASGNDFIVAKETGTQSDGTSAPEIGIYRERAHLLAYLSAHWKSVLAFNDPAEPTWPVLYINTDAGQMSWHISPDDVDLFPHVLVVPIDDPRAKWDGHSTAEKYDRLDGLVGAMTDPPEGHSEHVDIDDDDHPF